MRADSVFLAAGCLFAASVFAAPAQVVGEDASHLVGKSQEAHPPYSGGVIVIGGQGEYPDDDPSDNDDGGDYVLGPGGLPDTPPSPPPLPCTPYDSVTNPSFTSLSDPLANWTLSNPEETYTLVCPGDNADFSTCFNDQGFDQYEFDITGGTFASPTDSTDNIGNVAVEFYLDSPNTNSGIDTAGVSQWVSVCPGSTYTFSVHAYLDTTLKAPNDQGLSCSITLSLGTSTDTIPLTNIGTNNWSALVSNAYTTGADETRTQLDITLQCGQSTFSASGAADVYFDAVHLLPATPPVTSP